MKKLTTILLATAALLVAAVSCNKEGNEPEGRMAQLSYEVSLSEPVAKAIGDGSTVSSLACAVYDGAELYDAATVARTDGKFTYTPSLYYGKTYTIVFFAYTEGAYNVNDGLTTVTRNGNGEKTDAFTYKETVKINADGTLTIDGVASEQTASGHSVTLTRPFAQLNIGTESLDDMATAGATAVKVTLSGCAASYSALAGTSSGNATVTYTSSVSDFSADRFSVNGKDYSLVSLNYLFASDNVTAVIEVMDAADAVIRKITVDNLPIKANQRTNIYGNLVKGDLTFNVDINAGFGTEPTDKTIE